MTTSTYPGTPTLLGSSLFERGLAPLPPAPPTPPMLTADELVDWMALSQVIIGRVVRDPRGGDGQPMPGYLLPELLFDSLAQVGYVAFAAPDPLGLSTASLTGAGLARYTHLAQLGQPQP